MEIIIEVKNLKKNYGNREILKNISFSIRKGEIISIIGESGAGKSTLMRCINGLEKGYIQDLKKVNFENPKLLNDCILTGFISSKYSFKSLVAEKNVMISKLINPVKLPIPIRLTSIAAITKAGTVLKIEKHTVKNLARYLLDIFVAKKGEHKTAKRTPIKDEAKAVIIVSNILNKTIFLSSASILIIPAIRPFNLEKPSI